MSMLLGGSGRLAHGSPQQPRRLWGPGPATPPQLGRAPSSVAVGRAPPGRPTPASPSSRLGLRSLEPRWFNALLHTLPRELADALCFPPPPPRMDFAVVLRHPCF